MNIDRLNQLARTTLEQLVTDRGIFASSSKGEAGRYHALFGRDTIITAAFIRQAERLLGQERFLPKARQSVIRLSEWQGKSTHTSVREEPGKIPHEIWEDRTQTDHLVKGRVTANLKPFFVDETSESYVNFFSNDSTPLWVLEVCALKGELDEKLHKALEWCLHNIEHYNGFAGYEYDPDSIYHEPAVQSWKDSENTFMTEKGERPKQPIKDVAVNGFMWAALKMGSKYFQKKDRVFANQLSSESDDLKERFNALDGFLMKDTDGFYFSDALDGDNTQLKGICSDPGLCLWAAVDGECIIAKEYIPYVVNRLISHDFFDSAAGIRIYSLKNKIFDPEEYHRGANTFWPFVSGLTAWGMENFGYHTEAKRVFEAMLKGVERFDSCIEMFLKKGDEYVRYIEPNTKQVSSTDQAWTAGAVYYATAASMV